MDAMLYWFRVRAAKNAPGCLTGATSRTTSRARTAGLFLMGPDTPCAGMKDEEVRRAP